jgi:3-hydroxyisobutyrate dehydrogenase
MSPRSSPRTVRPRLGWIGTGVMGRAMCERLLNGGYSVTVHNRTRTRAEPLLDQGAAWAASPAEVASEADIVFTMVGRPSEVRDVILGNRGVLIGASTGAALVDMTTSEPSLATEIYAAAQAQSVGSLDAPVSGGDVGARSGTLSIFVGGDFETVERVRPTLELLGRTIAYQGAAGTGQHAKLVNQILIASGMIGIAEALVYARSAGLDLERVVPAVASGAAGSWLLSNLAPRALRGDLEPGFSIEHFLKDLTIALSEARHLSLSLPGLALARERYASLAERGDGEKGTQALLPALARDSALEWRSIPNFPETL